MQGQRRRGSLLAPWPSLQHEQRGQIQERTRHTHRSPRRAMRTVARAWRTVARMGCVSRGEQQGHGRGPPGRAFVAYRRCQPPTASIDRLSRRAGAPSKWRASTGVSKEKSCGTDCAAEAALKLRRQEGNGGTLYSPLQVVSVREYRGDIRAGSSATAQLLSSSRKRPPSQHGPQATLPCS